jgi:hypothetical protein
MYFLTFFGVNLLFLKGLKIIYLLKIMFQILKKNLIINIYFKVWQLVMDFVTRLV